MSSEDVSGPASHTTELAWKHKLLAYCCPCLRRGTTGRGRAHQYLHLCLPLSGHIGGPALMTQVILVICGTGDRQEAPGNITKGFPGTIVKLWVCIFEAPTRVV